MATSSNTNKQSYPFFNAIKDVVVRNAITVLWGKVNSLQGVDVAGPFRAPIDHGGFRAIRAADPVADQDLVTKKYAVDNFGPAAIQRALQAGGSNPLVTYNLPGRVGGSGSVFFGPHSDRLAVTLPATATGDLWYETDRDSWYQIESVSGVVVWVWTGGQMYGTINAPDQKPTDLGLNDAGFLFASVDFDRIYHWSGTAWQDALGQPQRGSIQTFQDTFAPTVGWQLCNGATVTRSTTVGGTTSVTVPTLNGRFVQFTTGATGATGGSATTHTHDYTDVLNHTHTVSITDPGHNHAQAIVNSGTAGIVGTQGASTADTRVAGVTGDNVTGITATTANPAGGVATGTTDGPSGSGGDDALPPYMSLNAYFRL